MLNWHLTNHGYMIYIYVYFIYIYIHSRKLQTCIIRKNEKIQIDPTKYACQLPSKLMPSWDLTN